MSEDTFKQLDKIQNELLNDVNKTEAEVIKQIVLVDSGALALLGVVVSSPSTRDLIQNVLITTSAALLFVSLASAIIHLVLTHRFFRQTFYKMREVINAVRLMKEDKQVEYFNKKVAELKQDGSTIPFWAALVSLLSAALTIAIFIMINIW